MHVAQGAEVGAKRDCYALQTLQVDQLGWNHEEVLPCWPKDAREMVLVRDYHLAAVTVLGDVTWFLQAPQVHVKHCIADSTSCMHVSSTTRWHPLHEYLMPQMFAPQQAHLTAANPNDAKLGAAAIALVVVPDGTCARARTVAARTAADGFSLVNAWASRMALDFTAHEAWVYLRRIWDLVWHLGRAHGGPRIRERERERERDQWLPDF